MSLKSLESIIAKLDKTSVEVGWFETSKYENGTPAAYVAAIQEWGYQGGGTNIPPRPFLRPAQADHAKDWAQRAMKEAQQVINGKESTDDAASKLGAEIEGDILEAIIAPHQPLSRITLLLRKWRDEGIQINKSTVERARRELAKNPNISVSKNQTPLDDTNYMISSLTYEVKTK